MTNTLTVKQLEELLQIQKDFDSRISTLNLEDSKIAYIVEFFEWFNTLETFKNWKKTPGKPLDVQLDELADMLAFALSIFNQITSDDEVEYKLQSAVTHFKYFTSNIEGLKSEEIIDYISLVDFNNQQLKKTLLIAGYYYSIDQLIDAYKKKMKRNHERQDGKADRDKGYV